MTRSTSNFGRIRAKRSFMRADWFLPRRGCFCFGLRSCVAVFAWCFATASFGCVILSIIFSARAYELDKDKCFHVNDVDSKKRELWVLTVSLLMYGLVSLPLGVLMLQGALQGRRTLIVPWLCGAGIGILLVVTMLVLMRAVLKSNVIWTISVTLGVLVFAWIHVFSLFYRLRQQRDNVRFSLQILSDNVDIKLCETPDSGKRRDSQTTVDQVVSVEEKIVDTPLITQPRHSLRPITRGLAVKPLPHRNLHTRFERRKPVLL